MTHLCSDRVTHQKRRTLIRKPQVGKALSSPPKAGRWVRFREQTRVISRECRRFSEPIDFVVWFYNQRGGAENLIKEANNDAGLAAHPSGRFDVNGNHFQLAMLAYNLNCWLMLFNRVPQTNATALQPESGVKMTAFRVGGASPCGFSPACHWPSPVASATP